MAFFLFSAIAQNEESRHADKDHHQQNEADDAKRDRVAGEEVAKEGFKSAAALGRFLS